MTKRPEQITMADLAAGERKYHPGGCPLCGYSFRGMGPSPVCPECRYPACLTCQPSQFLRHANHDWLRGILRGLRLHSGAGLLFVGAWFLFLITAMANRSTLPAASSAVSVFVIAATLASAVCGLRAVQFLSRPDPSGVYLGNAIFARRWLMPLSVLGLLSMVSFVAIARLAEDDFGRLPRALASVFVIVLCGSALVCLLWHARRLHWQTAAWTIESAQYYRYKFDWLHWIVGIVALIDIGLAVLPFIRGEPTERAASGSGCSILGFSILWACLGLRGLQRAIESELDPSKLLPALPEFGDAPHRAPREPDTSSSAQ